ncbi:uncharacterized protein LOC111249895 isoform X1 [Varroa destructor]|uniref:Uncharacterized protein n=1 Tax=Varroa destructor TaxID=109461 RepID=A0A7M7K9U4_VARDE|nr:uncharacterized protein LOC111249246 isoform X1 [Varroa destructor]XP_022658586.1 uncharacterized protein LOC111249246 isoform X1 [Varroa destructor]XP_022658587.1 uncharacterized protein LOC111249246 isoform X1 [Varroa destructor]XP_022658588.1 uncharacterized protein LOC111249246 isoform X1 [Varroa destructor]XP_022660090.1 uncharacterized protein LOC111249895 isoform X1 [Varroa destructor]XP_022660091.1 uncharacterized protein LOC111249895 isoform X1 [Varroa destructor]XP_022660092.1 un
MALISVMAYKAVEHVKQAGAFDAANETTSGTTGNALNAEAAVNTLSATVPPPARYNGKLMNSIWGLYNMHASHAFQKNIELAPGVAHPSVTQNGSRSARRITTKSSYFGNTCRGLRLLRSIVINRKYQAGPSESSLSGTSVPES